MKAATVGDPTVGSVRESAALLLVCALLLSVGCLATPRSEVAKFLARAKGRVAVAFRDPARDGPEELGSWDIRGDEPFAAGRAIGVFVLAELFRRVGAGEMALEDRVSVAEGTRPGHLTVLASVSELSLRDLAVLMLADGDPGATNVLIDRLGLENINRATRALGARRTILRRRLGVPSPPENYTTANDLAAAWASLAAEESFSADLRAEIERVLRVSRAGGHLVSSDKLPAADVRVHHDGDSPGRGVIVHGSGVLYLPDRQVALAVVGEGFESKFAGEEVVAQISRIAQARYEEDSRRADR